MPGGASGRDMDILSAIESPPRISYNDIPFTNKDQIMERTLVLLKPDCVERRLMGRVIARFED